MEVNSALEESAVHEISEELKMYLGDTAVLYVMTLNFHWNIQDPRFFSLHKLFEEHYKKLADFLDDIAERIRQLGIKAPGSMREFLQQASLQEQEGSLVGDQMIKMLSESHEFTVKKLSGMILRADELRDPVTVDLLTGHQAFHEKASWMLRSHL